MKKNLLVTVCFLIIALTLSAQDTLKVNFKPAGSPNEVGWDSILVSDKTLYDGGAMNASVFGGTVAVTPVWQSDPVAENVRSVNRDGEEYTGSLANVLRSYIAVDSRYENNCDIIGIEITGLPEGTYTFKSYHHDFRDQYGKFTVIAKNDGGNINADQSGIMISHSLSLEGFNDTYDPDLEGNDAVEYAAHYVTNSLDSITKYEYDGIVSSGESDVIQVSFRNVLPPDPEMGHNVKFVLLNGFELYESPLTDIENQFALQDIQIINETVGSVSISGEKLAEVIIYSIDGMIIKHVANTGNRTELSNLQAGIYIAKVGLNNGETISRKIVVR